MAKKKTPAPKKPQTNGISKMDGVRQAIGELGQAATRTEIQKYLKDRLNIDMGVDVISVYKSNIAKKTQTPAPTKPDAPKLVAPKPTQAAVPAKKKIKRKRRKKAAPKTTATVAAAPRSQANGIALSDLQTIQGLIRRNSVATLKGLIDVFSR